MAPKGPMTYAFTYGEISFSPPPMSPPIKALIPALRLIFQSCGPNSSLEAQIPASKLNSQAWGPSPSFKAQIPGLKAQIPGLRLKSKPWTWIPALKPKFQPLSQYSSLHAQTPALGLKSWPQDSNPSAKHRSPDPSGPADQYQALKPISQPIGSNHTLTKTA